MAAARSSLGARLRTLREQQGLTLRSIERASGLTSGYLSQLERGDVSQPTPTSLSRVAEAYGLELTTVMQWAGYASSTPASLTPEQSLALKHLGSNPTEQEVDAIRAVLEVLRNQRHTFAADPAHLIDRPLHEADIKLIREHAEALLRQADALGSIPTPLDQLTSVAELVYAGSIELTLAERRGLIRRLGASMLEKVLSNVEGLIAFRSREIWLKPNLAEVRRRFIHAHELGHHILPVHRELAYLDNRASLSSIVQEACEREANQAAIEMLAQGGRLTSEADDSPLTVDRVSRLADHFTISLQATARRVAEDSAKRRCAITRYVGSVSGGLMPPHVYPSADFAARDLPALDSGTLTDAAREAAKSGSVIELDGRDVRGRRTKIAVSTLDTPRASIAVVEARSVGLVRR